MTAHRLVGVHDAVPGRRRRFDAPLVGRDHERQALDETLERTIATGHSHLVTVLGAAGAGKTRLVTAFLDRVSDRAAVITGRCVSYGQGITYWPVVQMLREGLSLQGDESSEVVRHSIEQAMGVEPDRDDVAQTLLSVLGHDETPCSAEQAAWGVSRLVERLASTRPLVMNIDDLHWAEPTLLELLDQVRDDLADLPLLLVCQARPELLDSRPHWGGGLDSLTLGLTPFTQQETEAALAGLLGQGVPEEAVVAVSERAGGNPLFVEELAEHLVDVGTLRSVEGRWTVAGDLTRTAIPPTMAALLAARLDRLPLPERELLERLSVIGLEFSTADAVALTEPDTDVSGLLAALVRRDVLRRARGRGLDQWAFKHILVRDAAYEALPKELRADLHQQYAGIVGSDGTEAAGDQAAFVAHHLEQAARLRAELSPHDPAVAELVDRAVGSLMVAADVALARVDPLAAQGLIRRALDLEPSVNVTRELLVRLVEAQDEQSRVDEMVATLDEFESTFDSTETRADRAYVKCQRLLLRMAQAEDVDPADLATAAADAVDAARAAGRSRMMVAGIVAQCTADLMRMRYGEFAEATAAVRQAGPLHQIRWVEGLTGHYLLHGPFSVREYLDFVEAEARSSSMTPNYRAMIGLFRAQAMAALKGATAAQPELDAALAGLSRDREDSGLIEAISSSIARLSGEPAEAIGNLERVIEIRKSRGDLSVVSTDLAVKAMLMLEDGSDDTEVRRVVEQARAATSRFDVASVLLIRAADSILAARAGDVGRAEELATEALRLVDDTDDVWGQADLRRSLSEVAVLAGDNAWARKLLEGALSRYRVKEFTVLARKTEEQLAALPEPD